MSGKCTVTHLSTNQTQRWLTSVIRRKVLCGRKVMIICFSFSLSYLFYHLSLALSSLMSILPSCHWLTAGGRWCGALCPAARSRAGPPSVHAGAGRLFLYRAGTRRIPRPRTCAQVPSRVVCPWRRSHRPPSRANCPGRYWPPFVVMCWSEVRWVTGWSLRCFMYAR